MCKTHLVSIRSKFHETYSFVIFDIQSTSKYLFRRACLRRCTQTPYGRLWVKTSRCPPDERETKTCTKTFQIRDRVKNLAGITIANC